MKQMRLGDLASAAIVEASMQGEIESQIKDMVHRDASLLRKARPDSVDTLGAEGNKLVERISNISVEVIDRAISQLRDMKVALLEQNEKVRRELRALELANEDASGSLKAVSTVLAQWKNAPAVIPSPRIEDKLPAMVEEDLALAV